MCYWVTIELQGGHGEGIGIHSDRQGAAVAVAKGGGKDGGPQLRVRWMDPAECSTLTAMPMGRTRARKVTRTGMQVCEVVRGGCKVNVPAVDSYIL